MMVLKMKHEEIRQDGDIVSIRKKLTKVQCAFDDGHPGINDLGLALQQVDSLERLQQILQQLPQKVALHPAAT